MEIQTNIRELFAKSYESPDELTNDEILRLDAYFVNVVSILQQAAAAQAAGLATNALADGSTGFYFTGRFARTWFDINQTWIFATTPELGEAIKRDIESTPVQERFEYLEELKSRL